MESDEVIERVLAAYDGDDVPGGIVGVIRAGEVAFALALAERAPTFNASFNPCVISALLSPVPDP